MNERSELSKTSRRHSGSGMGAVRPHPRPWESGRILIGAEKEQSRATNGSPDEEKSVKSKPDSKIDRGATCYGQIVF